jgi:hypothetical protein
MGDEPDDRKADAVRRRIREAGERARAEAEVRRKAAAARKSEAAPREIHGSDGPDPVRHGDWEKKGVASDF